jgi:mRNA interferase MazF
VTDYVPAAGDLVWLTLDPQRGHEQAGRRPFLVLSPREYNAKTSLLVGAPVSAKRKGYPFQVELPPDGAITGVVLADQVKSLDWRVRNAKHAAAAGAATTRTVRVLLATLLELR